MELSKHNVSTNFDTACGIDGISHENLGRIPAGVAGGIYAWIFRQNSTMDVPKSQVGLVGSHLIPFKLGGKNDQNKTWKHLLILKIKMVYEFS